MTPDDETIALRVTVIGGKRHPDGFTVIWRDLPIGWVMKRSGVPSQADQWWWGFTFYRRPSLDGDMSGTEDCKAKFKIAWTRIKLPKGAVRLLSAWSKRLLEIENIRDQVVGLRVRDDQIRHLLVI